MRSIAAPNSLNVKNLSANELHHIAREKAYVHAHRSSEQNLCVSG